ncbi:MAG TPA: glycosyltransferase family A protein [Candidatus Polarisedimenticolaceae bacterium]|nr:glycosyltransferase family A protein [Candidatus Polarisedimenticolaceae bacterium]
MKVSVVIPAYNAAAFLGKTLRSVLEQSYADREVVVVDDGSSDGTAEVAASFPGVRVHAGPRRGVCAARNLGVQLANGAYVAFMDHDDLWEKDKLAQQVACLDAEPRAAFVFTQARVEREGTLIEIFPQIPDPARFLADAYENLVHWNYVPMSSVMARRDRLLALSPEGPFDPRFRLSEDWDLWLRLARAAGPGGVAFLPEPLTRYIILPGRATERMGDLRLEDLVIFEEQLRASPDLAARDPRRCRATRHRLALEAGYFLLKERRSVEARRCLATAWRARPFSLKPFSYWMASHLGLAPRSA